MKDGNLEGFDVGIIEGEVDDGFDVGIIVGEVDGTFEVGKIDWYMGTLGDMDGEKLLLFWSNGSCENGFVEISEKISCFEFSIRFEEKAKEFC